MKTTYAFLILATVALPGCSHPPRQSPHLPGSPVAIPSKPTTPSVADFTGTYAIDLDRSGDSVEHVNIRKNVRLTINADRSIVYGAGKITRYELVSDFSDQGVARYVSRIMIEGKAHESHCTIKLHPDGYLEVHGEYFRANKRPNVDTPRSSEHTADDAEEGFPIWFHSKFWHFEQYKQTGAIEYVLADDIVFDPPDPHRLAPKLLKAGLLEDRLTMPSQRPDGGYSYELTVEGEGLFRIAITREVMSIEKLPNPAD